MVHLTTTTPRKRKRLYQHLYFWVLLGIALGITFGLTMPEAAAQTKWMADLFIKLVKVVIAPTIFATIVVGIAQMGNLARAGGLALRTVLYFNVTTVFALAIGLVVVNVLKPGAGLDLDLATFDTSGADATLATAAEAGGEGMTSFALNLVPTSFVSAFVDGQLLQVLLIAVLVAVAVTSMGEQATPLVAMLDTFAHVMFGVIRLVMWVAPIGAFGGIAFTIGTNGSAILGSLAAFMGSFWLTCLLFVVLVLGTVCRLAGFSVFRYLRYIRDELLIVLGTSSSETVLPRLMRKMEAAGVPKHVVGMTIPTGYSFNLDGTAIYLTMASLFIATGMGQPMSIGEQIGLLVFMIIASKGAAGVTGAGLATLAGGLQAYRPDLVDGVGVIVGIDRFMSEGRALTNFTGNAVATLLIGTWTREIDRERVRRVLSGELPFDESVLDGVDDHGMADERTAVDAQGLKDSALDEMSAKQERARARAAQS